MEVNAAIVSHGHRRRGGIRQRLKLVGSDARIAETLKEMPTYCRIMKRMAAKLEHSIWISRKNLAETLLGRAGEFARVVEAAINRMVGFLVCGGLRIG